MPKYQSVYDFHPHHSDVPQLWLKPASSVVTFLLGPMRFKKTAMLIHAAVTLTACGRKQRDGLSQFTFQKSVKEEQTTVSDGGLQTKRG